MNYRLFSVKIGQKSGKNGLKNVKNVDFWGEILALISLNGCK